MLARPCPAPHFALLTTQLRFAAIQLIFKPSRFQFFMYTARNLRHPCVRCLRIRRAAAGAVDATSLRRADRATLAGPGRIGLARGIMEGHACLLPLPASRD